MPLYDFACPGCGRVFEEIVPADKKGPPCPDCGGGVRRLIGAASGYRADATWIESVLEVVERDSPAPHTRAFVARPCRATLRAWMRGEGLRGLEAGEKPARGGADEARQALFRETLARRRARRGA